MEEPQQQEAEAAVQVMCRDLTSVMGWELLLKITRHMDTAGRSSWRLVSKATCQAVYDSTTALAPCSRRDSTTALLPRLLAKCSGLKQLSCRGLALLCSVSRLLQLPLGLESLNISHTDIMDLSFIARCTSLQRLTAEYLPGCWGPAPHHLAAVLRQLPGLKALQLYEDRLGVEAARGVAAALNTLTGLEELVIFGIDAAAAAALLPALPRPKGLRLLDLGACYQAGQALAPAIAQLTRLQQLSLSNNALQAAGAATLAPALGKLLQLESLILESNGLRDEGMAALAPAIQHLTRLAVLCLRNNGLGVAGAQALAPALRHLTKLQLLGLSDNKMTPAGAAHLAPALQALTGLRTLTLRNTSLGAEGAATLAPAFQRLTALQHLSLGANALGPEGLHALLPAIQPLVALRSLSLERNGLDREGLLQFVAGLQQLSGLMTLDLGSQLGAGTDRDLLHDYEKFGQVLVEAVHAFNPSCRVSWR